MKAKASHTRNWNQVKQSESNEKVPEKIPTEIIPAQNRHEENTPQEIPSIQPPSAAEHEVAQPRQYPELTHCNGNSLDIASTGAVRHPVWMTQEGRMSIDQIKHKESPASAALPGQSHGDSNLCARPSTQRYCVWTNILLDEERGLVVL